MPTHEIVAIAQTTCAVVLALLAPFFDLPLMRRLKLDSSGPARIAAYRRLIVALWLAVAVVVGISGAEALFVVPREPGDFSWVYANPSIHIVVAVIATTFVALALFPGIKCIFDPDASARYARALKPGAYFLPASRIEGRWWMLASVSAGVCEEFLYRGFLMGYLHGRLEGGPHLGLGLAWLLSSVAFGAGHLYQGADGVVKTTIVGMAIGLVAILTGNLALPIVLHCLIDLQLLVMLRPASRAQGMP